MPYNEKDTRTFGLLCPLPGDLPDPEIKPVSLMSPALAGGFFTTSTTWEAPFSHFSSVQLLNRVRLFVTPWTAARQASLSITNSRSWWWTGKPGMLESMGSQRVGHDWATELNWIPYHLQIFCVKNFCIFICQGYKPIVFFLTVSFSGFGTMLC